MISIILTTHNGERYIADAITSVISQSWQDWEFVIVDDGSTDCTAAIIDLYSKIDSRITLFRNQENLGVVHSLNIGLKKAKGEYVARIDDDDVWLDTLKLEKQINIFQKNRDCILVGTNGVIVDEAGKKICDYCLPTSDTEIRKLMLLKNPFISSSVLFRKDAAIRVGGYFQVNSLKGAEDYDLWLKLGVLGRMFNISDPTVAYTSRKGNTSFRFKKDVFSSNIILIKNNKHLYPNYQLAILFTYMKYLIYILIGFLGSDIFRYRVYMFFYTNYIKFFKW